jgi:hypothetical protein
MLFPSNPCIIVKAVGLNEYGATYYGQRKRTLCSVVRLNSAAEKTSVRTDTSGTSGNAKEIVADARLLFAPNTKINVDDLVYIGKLKLRVQRIDQRFEVLSGTLDHLQVDLSVYES